MISYSTRYFTCMTIVSKTYVKIMDFFVLPNRAGKIILVVT